MKTINTYLRFLCGGVLIMMMSNACAQEFKMPPERKVFAKEHISLAKAACRGDVDKIARLVSAGADVNAPSLDGKTVLLWALACKSLDGVKALLEHGADPNLYSEQGYSAIISAGYFDDVRFLQTLLDHGGDVNAHDAHDTVLERAFSYGVDKDSWYNYHLLLERGANYDRPIKYEKGLTFLEHISGVYARFGEAERLFDKGFEGDLDELITTVERRKESTIGSAEGKRARKKFLDKLYKVRAARDLEREQQSLPPD